MIGANEKNISQGDYLSVAVACLCTVLHMNCAMIKFIFLLTSGDSEYMYMNVDYM